MSEPRANGGDVPQLVLYIGRQDGRRRYIHENQLDHRTVLTANDVRWGKLRGRLNPITLVVEGDYSLTAVDYEAVDDMRRYQAHRAHATGQEG